MSKFSVKKPFTVLVMVLVIIMLGVVSMMKMQMDLLPEISIPYVLIITTYPGASPEKVESTISQPLESALGTISGVENVYSYSYENYSMMQLEFADGTDMDSVLVKVYTALDPVKEAFPDEVGSPSVMELSVDMMATQYLAVAYEGMDIEELSRFVENTVNPEIERQNGVARVTTLGLIDQTIHIELDQAKVDKLNDKILGVAEDAFEDAMEDLEDAKTKLEESEQTIEDSKQDLIDAQKELDDGKQGLIDAQKELEDGKQDLMDAQVELDSKKQDLIDGEKELEDGQKELDDAKKKFEDGKKEFEDGKQKLEDTKKETYQQLAEASQMLEALETYRAQLVSQQATLAAVEAAIKAAGGDDTIKQLQDAIAAMTGLKMQLDMISASLGDADLLTEEQIGQLSMITGMLKQSGMDTSAFDTYLTSGTATGAGTKVFLKGYSDGIQGQIDEFSKTLGDLPTMIEQYKTEKTSLELEIQVTKGIIKQYEKGLKAAGIDYTDIEKAKMEAAAGFGSADAQMVQGQQALDQAEAQMDSAQEQLDNAKEQLEAGWDAMADGQQQINAGWDSLADGQIQIDQGWEGIEDGQKKLDDGWESLKDGEEQLQDGWESYYDGLKQFEKQRKEALRQANADQLLTLSTLAGLVYAQNFEMPAGYIEDKNSNSWLLKVGENYDSIEDLEDMVLCHIDDVGDVKLGDVANIMILDNSGTTYTKLNGNDSVIISVFKASTSGTNEVSKVCRKAIKNLEKKYDGLNILVMTDQGDYINLIVKNVVQNMVVGALLAIVILALFLKDFMPTIVVAISIPLSVLTAIVVMYFSKISLNMMSLSGMALGIGMLVDNSIVVIENIYRLRSRGVEAPRAAVQGTNQVAGAVVASTLTTVCVFFPIVFTNGMTRELMLPMSLTIIYCLMASLFIAMTVVPASASTLLRKTKAKKHPWFDKMQEAYGKTLYFCLKVKIVPLAVAIGLLALSVWQVFRMGIVMIPEMTSNQIEASVSYEDEDTPREHAYEEMDIFLDRAMKVEGIDSIGVMTGGSGALLVSTGTEDNYLDYSLMITTENEDAGADEVRRICDDLSVAAEDLDMELNISTGMSEMSSMLGSGLSITITGPELDKLVEVSNDVMNIISSVEGFENVSNGQEDADKVLHLNINKDLAMSKGLSVAQIFQDIAGKMTTSTDSVKIKINDVDMKVEIVNEMEPITVENLMDYSFAVKEKDEDGDEVTVDIPLSEIAELEIQDGFNSINRKNQTRYITISATVKEGYNATLLSRELQPLLEKYEAPEGYILDIGGESEAVNEMLEQMGLMILMGVAFIYFVMVAQFQSLLSPFIILFTLPLAFTGGLLALWFTGEQISVMAMMGLVVLLGTVVNNGIVFVDYTNQLRKGGMERRDALVATGKTRMRPILMTAMTTILAEAGMIFGDDMASQMGKGMALVIVGGLAYATLMTLYIIPVMYDILFKRAPLDVDTGSEDLDDVPDDAQEFMQEMLAKANKSQSGVQNNAQNDTKKAEKVSGDNITLNKKKETSVNQADEVQLDFLNNKGTNASEQNDAVAAMSQNTNKQGEE